jgi:hypothetical protein
MAIELLKYFPYEEMRPAQKEALEILEREWDNYDVFCMIMPTASGKCHAKGQGIIMYDGTVKKVEDIQVGDLLMGPDSTPRKVLELARGRNQMVQVVPLRGTPFTVTENHILPVYRYLSGGRHCHTTMEARDWFSFSKTRKHVTKLWKPDNIQFPNTGESMSIPPYILGLWLGDGNSDTSALTSMDKDLVDIWTKWGKENGCSTRIEQQENNKAATYYLRTDRGQINPCLRKLQCLNLINNKHIPSRYLYGSREERLELLAGLSDTDGNWNTSKQNFEITQVRKHLAEQILFLLRSLGFSVTLKSRVIKGKTYYRVTGSTTKAEEIPVRCSRKSPPSSSAKDQKHIGFTVKRLDEQDYYGFEIDGDHLYLLEDFTVTHNTSVAKTIMNALYSVSTLAPTNMLVKQFTDEFPNTNTLSKIGSYYCEEWQRPCQATRNRLLKYCAGCKCGKDMATAKFQRGPGIYNQHVYIAHKLHRKVLILDEGHTVINTIKNHFSLRIWKHDYRYPDNMWTREQMGAWVDSLPPKKKKTKAITALDEYTRFSVPNYVPQRTQEWFNGKGTVRGEPELRDCINMLPVDISQVPQVFWPPEVEKIVFMSGTISQKDIEQLGLARKRTLFLECKSPIPIESRPVIVEPVTAVTKSNMDNAIPDIVKYIAEIAEIHKTEKGLIHATYQLATSIRSRLGHDSRYIFHNKDNKADKYREFRDAPADSGKILVASGLYEGIDLPYDAGRWQIISKIPWGSLGNPAVKHAAALDPDWYNWETIKVVVQATGRICRTPTDYGITYIPDASFLKLIGEAKHLFPNYFLESLQIID